MILVLINVLIIVVIGALIFYLIDRFVRDGRLANLLKNSCGADLSCGNPAAVVASARRVIVLATSAQKNSPAPAKPWG